MEVVHWSGVAPSLDNDDETADATAPPRAPQLEPELVAARARPPA
jgi:hypothetical protein